MLLERAVVDKNYNEELWLEERRKGVTATEISKLAKGQPAQRRDLIKEKMSGERGFMGNRYTDWGLERETVLGGLIEAEHGFEVSDVLFFAADNRRHLATPDAYYLGENFTLIAEIKTSKYDLDPMGKQFQKSPYMDQMQWQMYVAGEDCNFCLFVWERHDDNWVTDEFGVERPTPFLWDSEWLQRDNDRIAELVLLADEFLTELDWILA